MSTRTVVSNDSYATRARKYLMTKSGIISDAGAEAAGFKLEYLNVAERGRRVVRMTVWDVAPAARDRRIWKILEESEDIAAAEAYDWAVEKCGMEAREARTLTGHDPRRVSEGLSDDFVEVSEELRELRVRMDGIIVAAQERGELVDQELAEEISEALGSLTGRVEECYE